MSDEPSRVVGDGGMAMSNRLCFLDKYQLLFGSADSFLVVSCFWGIVRTGDSRKYDG